MMYYGPGMSAWGYLLMTANLLLFWALVIGGIVVVVRYLGRSGRAAPDLHGPHARAEAILAERFAQGEIDEEEYRRRLSVLRGAPPT
jgi:putative membrane protein